MRRRVVTFVLFVAVCSLLVWLFEQRLSLDQLIAHESWLRQQVHEHPARSCLLGFVFYVAASLIPGTAGKSIVYGWVFGLAISVAIVTLALTLAATVSFCFSRYILYEVIHQRLGLYVARIDRALERGGGFYLFTMRLVHVPYTLTNYAMGVTTIRAGSFIWATLFGMLPGTCVLAYAGSQLPTLRTLAERGVLGVVSPQLMLAGTLLAMAPIVVRIFLRRFGFSRSRSEPS